jgi:hypothetical protein
MIYYELEMRYTGVECQWTRIHPNGMDPVFGLDAKARTWKNPNGPKAYYAYAFRCGRFAYAHSTEWRAVKVEDGERTVTQTWPGNTWPAS